MRCAQPDFVALSVVWIRGGVWSSSLLLLALFFVQKSTQGQQGAVEDGHVLRFRSAADRKALMRELVDMGVEEVKVHARAPAAGRPARWHTCG